MCVCDVDEILYNLLFLLSEDQIPRGFPTIDMGPQLKVVERTRTATMLCAASGNPDPEITWFKDYLPVDTSNSNGRIKQLRSGKISPLLTPKAVFSHFVVCFLFVGKDFSSSFSSGI